MTMDAPEPARSRDRSRWIIPLVVAVIAALATVRAAVLPGLLAQREKTRAPRRPARRSASHRADSRTAIRQPHTMTAPKSHAMSLYTGGIRVDLPDANDTLPDLAIVDGAIKPRNSAAFAVFPQGQPESRG